MNNRKKFLMISAFMAVFILSATSSYVLYQAWTKPAEEGTMTLEKREERAAPESIENQTKAVVDIKDSVQLIVPYTVLAPFANWAVHEESCEEAAALMYHYFLTKESFSPQNIIPPDRASAEMVAMKNWQKTNYGLEPDLSIEKFGDFVKSYYGHNFTVSKNITKEDIQKALSTGSPVIVPVITHGLQNPNYGRLPSYHLLVITGYDAGGVITNDAGVKEGQNYKYSWETLFSAIDQQTTKMNQGREMIVIY